MNRKTILVIKLILLILVFVTLGIIALNFSGIKSMAIIEGQERTFSGVEKIVVEAISLPIKVYESDVAQVTIKDNTKEYGLKNAKPNTMEQKGDVVTLKQGKSRSFLSYVIGEFVIEVPRGSILEYDVSSISGSIDHDAISKDMLIATSVSGSVRIHQEGQKALMKSTSGSVRIHSPFEEIKASSVSGSVYVVANKESKQILASSVSGSVRIQLENVTGYDFDYSTTSGSVKDSYENLDYSKSGFSKMGDSSLKITASSVSGSIRLEDWNN